MIHGAPQVNHLAVKPDIHLIKMPSPVAQAPHPANPLATDVGGEQRAETVPPQPHRLMADVDPALEQQVLDVPANSAEIGHTAAPPNG
ncbi:MAG: hypothetical protein ABWZ75_04680 [Novosphingobium sp.]